MKAFCTLLLALVTGSGYAQQYPSTPPTLTHADSVEILHQAFRSFRHRDHRGLALAGTVGVTQVIALTYNPSPTIPFRTGLNLVGAVGCGWLLTDYIRNLTKLSKRREEEALQRLELHQPQPQFVQRLVIAYTSGKRKL
ncbi:hypothetical protein A8B98_00540 [Hymenobacter sp. UV11]|nr:hypothetical protein A8B98_00540 [Hymenobacter sp. UV11]